MPHVLLIRPLCEGDELEFAEPLGIERLAGFLRRCGVARVTLLDRRLYEQERRAGRTCGSFWGDLRQACVAEAPCLVGLSLMTSSDVPDALRIISRVRAQYPAAHLAAGGLYVTTNPREARARLPRVVTLLAGEGERALAALACACGSGDAEPQVAAGADDAESPQVVADAGDAELPQVLTPDDWAPAYRPALTRYAALGCAVNMQTSRGCPGGCTFCATPGMGPELRRWTPRDLSLVVDEVEAEATRLAQAGLPAVFNFVDDDFGPLTRVEALARELERRQLRVAFALEMRLAALIGQPQLAERLARLHEAGLTRVFVGVESLNRQTLRAWRKPYDVDGLASAVAAFRAAGVTLQTGYILWHAGQSLAGARAEVEGMARLGLYSHRVAQSRLIVFAGCELAAGGADSWGFQRMDASCEEFYQRFCDETSGLAPAWTAAAVAEPYAAAEAFLTGDTTRLEDLRATLREVNEASLAAFRTLADAAGAPATDVGPAGSGVAS